MANLPRNAQYAVIEMGISHVGEMEHLSDLVRPNVSVITNIAPAHQEFFKTLEMTATEKAHIMDYQDKNGTIVISADTECADLLFDTAHLENMRHIVRFGKNEKSDIKLQDIYVQKKQMQVTAKWHGETLKYALNFLGSHYAMDSLAVLGAVDAVGASVSQAIQTLLTLAPTSGRGQIVDIEINGKKVSLIDDAYNANPSSMKAGLKMLALFDERRVAVMGDMLELGAESPERHLDLLENLTQNGPSKVYAVGTQMKQVFDLLPDDQKGAWAETPEALFSVLVKEIQNGDVIWVKSSHGTGLYRLVEKLKGTK